MKLRPAIFGAGLLGFLLPFVTISCAGMSQSFTGVELVTGGTIQGQHVNGELLALLAGGCGVVGLLAAWVKPFESPNFAVGAGGLGVVLLLMLEAKLRSDVSSKGPIQLTIETGYWVTLVAYVAGAGLGIREITAGRGVGGRATDDRAPDV